MIIFPCQVCRTSLSAEDSQAGELVRCPTCSATLRVPATQAAISQAVAIPRRPPLLRSPVDGMRGSGRRYGFNCGYCSSRLEATEAMAAQDGQCPTCGNNITIPILDRYGRLIDPKTMQIIKQDPHPVHAYAAAGDRAPQILRKPDGAQTIQCPRCRGMSPITANNCKACGMPFTMEGTTLEAAGTSNGFCVASLVLGVIGLPTFCIFVPALLAVVFGIIGYTQTSATGVARGGKGMAVAGIVCGGLGMLIGAIYWFNHP